MGQRPRDVQRFCISRSLPRTDAANWYRTVCKSSRPRSEATHGGSKRRSETNSSHHACPASQRFLIPLLGCQQTWMSKTVNRFGAPTLSLTWLVGGRGLQQQLMRAAAHSRHAPLPRMHNTHFVKSCKRVVEWQVYICETGKTVQSQVATLAQSWAGQASTLRWAVLSFTPMYALTVPTNKSFDPIVREHKANGILIERSCPQTAFDVVRSPSGPAWPHEEARELAMCSTN